MIAAAVLVHALHRHQISRLFDDADGLLAPLWVTTDGAEISFGQAKAFLTKGSFSFDCPDRFG